MKTLLFVCLFLSACAGLQNKFSASSAGDEHSNLSQVDAAKRSKRVSQVRYLLAVKLNKTPTYAGEEQISFDLTDTNEDLRLDFFHGDIKALEINGKSARVSRTPTFINLQKSLLQTGANTVKISFVTEMQNNGTGLHRFEDPEDKSIYLYTQFEDFHAHKFMPCFDQPDLKAKLKMAVTAPGSWTVVSTTREGLVDVDGETRTWYFSETPPISTYLFSLHAGPFRIWEDEFEGIPLRLMARPSMAKFVRPEFWFRTTKQGFGFYNKFFAYAYPFKKYDQVIVPEFNAGAMENVGAVTFSERYLQRGHMSREDEHGIASVVLHEMAHMWFGDLVTMRWWNDLWLNESFATYMSALATDQATPFKESWTDFFRGTKQWAYYQDQLSTTHPIEGLVPDTDSSHSAFDGITYGKGASVLKQMSRWLTPQDFKKGVQDYMQAYAFKNAELNDFIGSLQKVSKRDLVGWSKVWLQQAGLDTVSVSVSCKGDRLDKISLESTPSVPATFRTQSVVLGLYRLNGNHLSLGQTKAIEMESAKQDFSFPAPCPSFVYPNYGDHGYMKVTLDQKSIPVLGKSISTLPDPLSRLMVWSNLWQMVRDQEIPLTDYAKIASAQLANESDPLVLRLVVSTISGSGKNDFENVIGYWPAENSAVSGQRQAFIEKMEAVYKGKLLASKSGSDMQSFWWDSFVRLSRSEASQKFLAEALRGTWKLKGLEIDQDRRWSLVGHLCRFGAQDCRTFVENESKLDSSDRGVRASLSSLAAFPDPSSKEKLLAEALHSPALSLQKRKAIVRSLFPYEQKKMAESQEKVFYGYIEENKHTGDMQVLEAMAGSLSSLQCAPIQDQRLVQFMEKNKDLPSPIQRGFREDLDEDARCQKIRAKIPADAQVM
ncbi:MAG: aminopeptidase N [Bdellovibrionota bacterium]